MKTLVCILVEFHYKQISLQITYKNGCDIPCLYKQCLGWMGTYAGFFPAYKNIFGISPRKIDSIAIGKINCAGLVSIT